MKQHSSHFLTLVNEAKKQIKEVSPETLKKMLAAEEPPYVIDVREKEELSSGRIAGAIHLSKGIIERDIEKTIPDLNTPIVVYCSGGFRCALVAASLQSMGYTKVSSLSTGLQGWIDAGFGID